MTTAQKIAALKTRIFADGWALLPLRLIVGFGFAAHGYAKLERGPEHFAVILAAMGIPAPDLTAWVTSLLELLGGIALMLGAFVAALSVPLIIVMLTALFGVHLRYGFSSIRLKAFGPAGAEFGPPGYELNLLYIAALLTLALAGPTRVSVARWLTCERAR
jgi:putative oxidoreductase